MPFTNASSNLAINNSRVAQGLQQQQLQGILDLFAGHYNSSGQKQTQGFLDHTKASNTQSLADARTQAIQDTQGLTAAAVRDFNNSILPQITGAAEGAGASASALTALLAQNAAAASAGVVAKNQGAQIISQENLANQANIAQGKNQTQIMSTILSQLLQQFAPRASSGGGGGSKGNYGGIGSPQELNRVPIALQDALGGRQLASQSVIDAASLTHQTGSQNYRLAQLNSSAGLASAGAGSSGGTRGSSGSGANYHKFVNGL